MLGYSQGGQWGEFAEQLIAGGPGVMLGIRCWGHIFHH